MNANKQTSSITEEQIKLSFSALPIAVVTTIGLMSIMAVVMTGHAKPIRLTAWVIAMCVIALARAALWYSYQRHSENRRSAVWGRLFTGSAFIAGVAWGAASILFFPATEFEYQAFLAFIVAGISAGATVSMVGNWRAMTAFVVPCAAPLAYQFFLQANQLGMAMGAMVVIYIAAITFAAKRTGTYLIDNFALRIAVANSEQQISKHEGRLALATQAARIGAWELDLSSNSLILDSITRHLYGWNDDLELPIKAVDLLRRIHPDDQSVVVEMMRAAIAGAGSFDAEIRVTCGGLPERIVKAVATVSRDASGRAQHVIGINWDITERTVIDRLKTEFVATVSHELRTPLTSIQASLGLVIAEPKGSLSDKARRLIEIAHRNSERLTRLVNDILDFEKMEFGDFKFDVQLQPLAPLLEQALETTAGNAAARNVRLTVKASPLDLFVVVHASRLLQVLTNLLSNAVKFSPANSEVEVVVVQVENRIRLEVHDSGPGIAREFQPRVFEKFSQADASDGRTKGGTGLGLAISKAIIEGMGGTIGFDTVPNRGCVFYFEIPGESRGANATSSASNDDRW